MLIVLPDRKSNRFRLRRFKIVQEIIAQVISEKGACRILDVGGTPEYWEAFGADLDWDRVQVSSVNVTFPKSRSSRVKLLSGDARDLKEFPDLSFDFVHSNSVIEHVGRWNDMVSMAAEVRRLAPRYYVQTPYQWFPMEPHAVFPFFHWMPESWRYRIVMRHACGFWPRQAELGQAMNTIQSAALLDKQQMRYLFPDAKMVSEKVLGLTKSLIAIR
jgi:SAM-dependent methyltransferase